MSVILLHDKRKAQVSVEMLVVVGFVIVLSTVVIFGISEKNIRIELLRENLYAQKQAQKLSSAIDTAVHNGDGFSYNITVSRYAGRNIINEFKIVPSARVVEIKWTSITGDNRSVVSPIATNNIGAIDITKNIINVYNNNSVILVTQYD